MDLKSSNELYHKFKEQFIVCPACGEYNIIGVETCSNCMSDLTSLIGKEITPSSTSSFEIRVLKDPIKKIPCPDAPSINFNLSLLRVIEILDQGKFSALVVEDEHGSACGVISRTEILNAVVTGFNKLSEMKAKDVMSTNFIFLEDTNPIVKALNALQNKYYVIITGDCQRTLTPEEIFNFIAHTYPIFT